MMWGISGRGEGTGVARAERGAKRGTTVTRRATAWKTRKRVRERIDMVARGLRTTGDELRPAVGRTETRLARMRLVDTLETVGVEMARAGREARQADDAEQTNLLLIPRRRPQTEL